MKILSYEEFEKTLINKLMNEDSSEALRLCESYSDYADMYYGKNGKVLK